MKKKEYKYLVRLVMSYSIILLLILIIGVYFYNVSTNNVIREIQKQNKITLYDSIMNVDKALDSMEIVATQIASCSTLVQLANLENNMNDNFYIKAFKAKRELSTFTHTISYLPISTYLIYLQNSEFILSFSHFQNMKLYYQGIKCFNKDYYNSWYEMMISDKNYKSLISLDNYTDVAQSTMLYKLPLNESSLRHVPAVLCYEIDVNKLSNFFTELNLYDNGYLIVTDENGNLLFQYGNELNEVEKKLKNLQRLEYDDNLAFFDEESQEYLVTSFSSDKNKWNYYYVQQKDKAFFYLENYKRIFTIGIALAISLGFILIVFLSKRNLRPMKELKNILDHTILERNELAEFVEQQNPVIRNAYLQKIIYGQIATDEELQYIKQYLNIKSDSNLYYIINIKVYDALGYSIAENQLRLNDSDLNILMILEEFFGESIMATSVREQEYVLIDLHKMDDSNTMDSAISKFNKLKYYLENNFNIKIIGGMSHCQDDLNQLWKAYRESEEATRYANNENPFMIYQSLERNSTYYYFPEEIANQLISFIHSGKEERVKELFVILYKENVEKRELKINLLQWLCEDIRRVLLKVRFEINETKENYHNLLNIDLMFEKTLSIQMCEQIALALNELFIVDDTSNKLIDSIRDYIDKNYLDSELSLAKISELFYVSEGYFSYLFKEVTGENFSNYLEKRRMEEAIRLIKETDINVSTLYLECGYKRPDTFRRAFKKIYGVPPKNMREMKKIEKTV